MILFHTLALRIMNETIYQTAVNDNCTIVYTMTPWYTLTLKDETIY